MDKAEKIANSSKMVAATVKSSEDSSTGFPFSSELDLMDNQDHYSGFMELLGVSDFSTFLDFDSSFQTDLHGMMLAKSPSLSSVFSSGDGVELPETSPTILPTPHSHSSISTSSSEGNGDEGNCKDQRPAEEKHGKDKKSSLKPRKKGTKREREPRFAFMTKSDVDHLEDGYRWRKYGQKAVKNSPFPRGYYRCTSIKCGVKKRVERSWEDPSIVITTYEGQHTHHSPAVGRPAGVQLSHRASPTANPSSFLSFPHAHVQQPQLAGLLAVGSHASPGRQIAAPASQQLVPRPHAPALPRDGGLLQDILPSGVRE